MICPFCLNNVPQFHSNSHIIPEWMYENSYDDIHRTVSLDLDNLEKDIVQQGHRGSFICNDCEMRFSKDDYYGYQLFSKKFQNRKIQKELEIETRKINLDNGITIVSRWSNFNFKKLQNFIFSILIRNHLWKRPVQKKHLNDAHFNRIKNIYLNEAIVDDVSYPIQIIKLIDSKIHNPVILPYITPYIENHKAYIFAGAGYLFQTYISSHRKPSFIETSKIQRDGSAIILHVPFEESGIFKNCLPRILKIKQNENLFKKPPK